MRRSACASAQSDQHHFICFLVSMIDCLKTCGISILQLVSVAEQAGLCTTWSKIPKTHFLSSRSNGIQNLDQQFMRKLSLKDLSILTLVAILFRGAEPLSLWRLCQLGNFQAFFVIC